MAAVEGSIASAEEMDRAGLPETPDSESPNTGPLNSSEAQAPMSLFSRIWWPPILALGGALYGARSLTDNSFLTHLATGRLILDGRLPRVDPYTFTGGGRPWIAQSWLASWLYAVLEDIGGAFAIRAMIAAVGALLALGIWRLSAPVKSVGLRLLVVVCAPAIGGSWWNERPQILAFALVVACAIVLVERRSSWWLLPMFAIWMNVHGSFPLGGLFVSIWAGTQLIRTRRVQSLLPVGALGAGIALGTLFSPYGLELAWFPVKLLSRGEQLKFMAEWQPLRLDSPTAFLFVAEVLVLGYVMARERDVLGICASAIFVVLAATAVRNTALAAIVMIPFASNSLSRRAERIGALPESTWFGDNHRARQQPGWRATASASVAVALLVALFLVRTPGYALDDYPTRAVSWMQARSLVANPGISVLSTDYTGNYLEWRYGASAQAWIDDRAELHSVDLASDYVHLLLGKGETEELLERNPHDLILWPEELPLAKFLESSAEYQVLTKVDGYLVACRVGGSVNCAGI